MNTPVPSLTFAPRRVAAGGLIAALLIAAPLALGGDEKHPAKKPAAGVPPHPVVETHELMELFNQPFYEFLKAEMEKGVPDSDQRWSTLHDRGLQAAELANLVALRPQE